MKEKLFIVFFVLLLILTFPNQTHAKNVIAGGSAVLKNEDTLNTMQSQERLEAYIKYMAIHNVLKRYNSPLLPYAKTFIESSIDNNLNSYLVVSISGVESGFGKFLIPGTYNPFGWGQGKIYFESFEDAINTVSLKLRTRYINKGAHSVYSIGLIYAGTTSWSRKVNFFISQFKQEEEKIRSSLLPLPQFLM